MLAQQIKGAYKMYGVSKIIATEQDVLNNMEIDKGETLKLLLDLREGRFSWFKASRSPLPPNDLGLTDATHKVLVEPIDGNSLNDSPDNIARYQYEYVEDPHAPLFRAGLTVQKVQRYIDACS